MIVRVFSKVDEIGSVFQILYDSCFCAIGCNSESMKLEIWLCSVGPLLPETIGLQPTGIFSWIFVCV